MLILWDYVTRNLFIYIRLKAYGNWEKDLENKRDIA